MNQKRLQTYHGLSVAVRASGSASQAVPRRRAPDRTGAWRAGSGVRRALPRPPGGMHRYGQRARSRPGAGHAIRPPAPRMVRSLLPAAPAASGRILPRQSDVRTRREIIHTIV